VADGIRIETNSGHRFIVEGFGMGNLQLSCDHDWTLSGHRVTDYPAHGPAPAVATASSRTLSQVAFAAGKHYGRRRVMTDDRHMGFRHRYLLRTSVAMDVLCGGCYSGRGPVAGSRHG